jgi:hypothetical protein
MLRNPRPQRALVREPGHVLSSGADDSCFSHAVAIPHHRCELEFGVEHELALDDGTSLGSRLQKYFLDQLPSLVRQHLPSEVAVPRNFILGRSSISEHPMISLQLHFLVTSVLQKRTASFNQPYMPRTPCVVCFKEFKDPEPSGQWGHWVCFDVPVASTLPIDTNLCKFDITYVTS